MFSSPYKTAVLGMRVRDVIVIKFKMAPITVPARKRHGLDLGFGGIIVQSFCLHRQPLLFSYLYRRFTKHSSQGSAIP